VVDGKERLVQSWRQVGDQWHTISGTITNASTIIGPSTARENRSSAGPPVLGHAHPCRARIAGAYR
jgi:hypothetical protein